MKQFDYKSAWHEQAKPAYLKLSKPILQLLEKVAVEAADLRQDTNYKMFWPATDLRERMNKIELAELAFAARVINCVGHWRPSDADIALPGSQHGAHWKFSNYADQVLRERLKVAGETPFQIIEGAIRLCYSSAHMWTWAEVAPATTAGLIDAQIRHSELTAALTDYNLKKVDRDGRAYDWFEELKKRDLGWPAEWVGIMDTGKYMREEQAIKADKKPTKNDIQRVIDDCEKTIREATHERDGLVWLLQHGINTDNVIDYHHENGGEGLFCFGWREPVIDSVRDAILAAISEFPFAYRIKCADGKVLEGGIR